MDLISNIILFVIILIIALLPIVLIELLKKWRNKKIAYLKSIWEYTICTVIDIQHRWRHYASKGRLCCKDPNTEKCYYSELFDLLSNDDPRANIQDTINVYIDRTMPFVYEVDISTLNRWSSSEGSYLDQYQSRDNKYSSTLYLIVLGVFTILVAGYFVAYMKLMWG
jgi:hypothetical protein